MLYLLGGLILAVTGAITATVMALDAVIRADRRERLGESYVPPRRIAERLRERIVLRWDTTKRIR